MEENVVGEYISFKGQIFYTLDNLGLASHIRAIYSSINQQCSIPNTRTRPLKMELGLDGGKCSWGVYQL